MADRSNYDALRRRIVLAGLGLAALGGLPGGVHAEPVAGRNYTVLDPALPVESADKIEVLEFFWYGCPHCYNLQPYMEKWVKTLPADVQLRRVPAIFNQRWARDAYTFYAFEALGVLEKVHRPFFDAIHVKRQRLTDLDTIAGFAAEQGIDEKLFRENYYSFPVETQIRKNVQIEKRYGHNGVPAVIVNGKYLVSASLAGSNDRMIEIIDFLIARERSQ